MKSLKFLVLAASIGVAFSLTSKGAEDDSESVSPGQLMYDLTSDLYYQAQMDACANTLKNLEALTPFALQYALVCEQQSKADPNNQVLKANAENAKDQLNKLVAWHDEVEARLNTLLNGRDPGPVKKANDKMPIAKKNSQQMSRDAANDAASNARDASVNAARGTVEAVRGTMNCPDGH